MKQTIKTVKAFFPWFEKNFLNFLKFLHKQANQKGEIMQVKI